MRNRLASTLPFALLAVFLAAAPPSEAQLRGAGAPVWHGQASGMGRGFSVAVSRTPSMQRVQRPAVFLGSPYFYSDYPVEPVVQQAPSQVVVVQPPAAPEHAKDDVVQPLMIEWQGDHYASVSTTKGEAANTGHGSQDNTGASPKTLVASAKHPVQTKSAPAKAPLPPVVLVYRDGHREKIHDYTIVGGTIYARGDYWTDGYWNKKIQLAALDLPATAKASQADGAKFILPSSPNEVVTRP